MLRSASECGTHHGLYVELLEFRKRAHVGHVLQLAPVVLDHVVDQRPHLLHTNVFEKFEDGGVHEIVAVAVAQEEVDHRREETMPNHVTHVADITYAQRSS